MGEVESVWGAITTGLRDYVEHNGFKGVALGLSAGIDSSVSAALAVDAVGAERVVALAMPSPETGAAETDDAERLAENLGIDFDVIPVGMHADAGDLPLAVRQRHADGSPLDRERHYARARAAVLGAIFGERGFLVLATGNKSEISIGAASLAGDLLGDFAPLKDCPKTLVYELAGHRQLRSPVFPPGVLRRPATTQRLGPEQLPEYEDLDDIVRRHVEHGEDLSDVVDAGHDPDVALYVLHRFAAAERTRRYSPPGVKVTSRAFGQDSRLPISNAWRTHPRPH